MYSSDSYYQHARPELISEIPIGNHRILDVGCAEGFLGESLKQSDRASEVIGIEISSKAAGKAERKLDRVISGNLDVLNRDKLGLEPSSFDYIICGDVLEHLSDPWGIVQWLETLLKNDGKLIASIPNVRHWSVVLPLLFKGTWTYHSEGIMDQTHMRFFTRKSAIDLIEQSGLVVQSCDPLMHRKIDKIVYHISFGLFSGFAAYQWLISARKI